jgi:acetoin utilization deacetylase AcuC-like enzyme
VKEDEMAVSVVRDAIFQQHLPGPRHPESPERLRSIDAALAASSLELVELPAKIATNDEISRVHREEYLAQIEATRGRSVMLDADTQTSPHSYDAAVRAAGAAISLVTSVARGAAPAGIALVRPPGHHAYADRAMGFCLFNNIAVAVEALRAEGLAERIAIYDFDVHHGNGTEAIFYEDPNVLFMSTHQYPFYPGTGASDAIGSGRGTGANLNVPLRAGTGDELFLEATEAVLEPKVRAFRPDIILMSAGFDAFELDPLGGLKVTVEGFRALAKRWRVLAEELCAGRMAAFLEGGYHLEGLGASVRAFLEGWDE